MGGTTRKPIGEFPFQFFSPANGRIEPDDDVIVMGLKKRFDVEAISPKHIVCLGDFLAVEENRSESVQPFDNQLNMRFLVKRLGNLKLTPVFPVLVLDPLDPELIIPVERVRNEPIFQEV